MKDIIEEYIERAADEIVNNTNDGMKFLRYRNASTNEKVLAILEDYALIGEMSVSSIDMLNDALKELTDIGSLIECAIDFHKHEDYDDVIKIMGETRDEIDSLWESLTDIRDTIEGIALKAGGMIC